MTIQDAIKLTRNDQSYDRRHFFNIGKECEFELPSDLAPLCVSSAMYLATEFADRVCPHENFGSRQRGEAVAYGALREGVRSAAYVRLLKLVDNLKLPA